MNIDTTESSPHDLSLPKFATETGEEANNKQMQGANSPEINPLRSRPTCCKHWKKHLTTRPYQHPIENRNNLKKGIVQSYENTKLEILNLGTIWETQKEDLIESDISKPQNNQLKRIMNKTIRPLPTHLKEDSPLLPTMLREIKPKLDITKIRNDLENTDTKNSSKTTENPRKIHIQTQTSIQPQKNQWAYIINLKNEQDTNNIDIHCEDCLSFTNLIKPENRHYLYNMNSGKAHTIMLDLQNRLNLLSNIPSKDKLNTLYSYVNINLRYRYKNISDKQTDKLLSTNTITKDNLHKILLFTTSEEIKDLSCRPGITSDGRKYYPKQPMPGRTLEGELYYPRPMGQTLQAYINNFNNLQALRNALLYHPWENTTPDWIKTYTSQIKYQFWSHYTLIKLNSWIELPCIVDWSGQLWGDCNALIKEAQLRGVHIPDNIYNLVTMHSCISLQSTDADIMQEIVKKHIPHLVNSENTHTLVPLPDLARTAEIIESLLALSMNIHLFTPITGTVDILGEKIPYIIIGGKAYIPWSWSRLIIPNGKQSQNIHSEPPLRIHNWLHLHLQTAAKICSYTLDVSLVAPLYDLIIGAEITASWGETRNKERSLKLIHKLKTTKHP